MNSLQKKKFFQVFLGLSLLGWVNSLYTLFHRQSLLAGGLTKPSFCNINESFNCDATALSSYSSILGLPTSSLGLVFYSAFILLSIWALVRIIDRKDESIELLAAPIFLTLSAIGLAPTFYLAFISAFQMKTVCPMCLLSYLINISLFLSAFVFYRQSRNQPLEFKAIVGSFPKGLIWTFIFLSAFHLFLPKVFDGIFREGAEISESEINAYIARHLQNPVKDLNLQGRPGYGPTSAKVTVVVFSDFQCPHCAREALTTPQILAQYRDQSRFVFKNYPLDSACNPEMKSSAHPHACTAAKTAYCVFKIKGDPAFFEIKKSFFMEQAKLSVDFIKKKALEKGLNDEALNACVNDYSTHQLILDDVADGNRVGVQGTPTVFVNGKLFEGGGVPKIFQALLQHYLKPSN